MAEPRRVQLSTVPSPSPFLPSPPKKPRPDSQEQETPVAATVRIALSLFEPDQKRCPEFFYPELLRNLQGNSKKDPPAENKKHVSPFDDEEAERKEVEKLAKKFEEKYSNKKKRKDRVQDLIDMGYGYDDSDSFIDNSEARHAILSRDPRYWRCHSNSPSFDNYCGILITPKGVLENTNKLDEMKRRCHSNGKITYDELVPASLTTKYGGFYINSGTLQFRQASDSEDEFLKEKKKKSPKKMKERGEKIKKKKREEEKKGKKNKHPKPGFTALNGAKDKKKKKPTLDVNEMLARFAREKEAEKSKSVAPAISTAPKVASVSSVVPGLPPPPPREAEPAPDPLFSTIVSETELLQAASAIDALSEKDLENLLNLPPEKGTGGSVMAPSEEFKKPPSMPDGLPSPLEVKIKELTLAVRASEGDKKTILFTGKMNNALLDIYLLSRNVSPALRSAVFTHLSSVLPCSKDTLVKWASRLYLHKQQGGRLQEPLRKLKDAVLHAMPEQINKYNKDFKIYNEAKYAKMLADDKDKEQKAHSEEEEEEDKGSRKPAGPRKKFQWTEEIRQLLSQLVRIKMDMFEPEGSGGMLSLEDYFKSFLDTEVKPIWPRGWMQARTLFNESRRLYPHLSSIMAKNKPTPPSKVKVKESSNKAEKTVSPSPVEVQGAAVSSTLSTKSSPVAPVFSTSGSPCSTYNQDNSLDGDLIRNPPSLDAVSEHLNVLSNRTSTFDFPVPKSSVLEKTAEEKKKTPPTVSIANISHASARPPIFTDKPSPVLEKKQPMQVHSSKMMSEVLQKPQQQAHGQVKINQVANPSLQPSVKLYHMNSQHIKGSFPPPNQSSGPRVTAPSPPQRSPTPQNKSPKPQAFTSPPSNVGIHHKPVVSPSLLGKHPVSSSTVVSPTYRPAVPRLPVSQPSISGNTIGLNNIVSVNQSPPSLLRNPAAVPAKKPIHPSQKLTLMALQDSGKGTQGVAKLLTSSMIAGAGVNKGAPPNLNQTTKCNTVPGIITPSSSPSLTVLTPTYKPNGGKIPNSASLGLIPTIHQFPLRVIYTTDAGQKASKDAIVTGPAPGTFNHGLARNLLGALHSPTTISHSVLAGHSQPAQTDVAHAKTPVPPQRKL